LEELVMLTENCGSGLFPVCFCVPSLLERTTFENGVHDTPTL